MHQYLISEKKKKKLHNTDLLKLTTQLKLPVYRLISE